MGKKKNSDPFERRKRRFFRKQKQSSDSRQRVKKELSKYRGQNDKE